MQELIQFEPDDQWVEFITLHAPGQDLDAPEMELVKQAWKTAKNYHSLGSWSSLMTAFTTGYDLCDTGLKKQDAIQRFENILSEMGV
jgi:hypothetical protein